MQQDILQFYTLAAKFNFILKCFLTMIVAILVNLKYNYLLDYECHMDINWMFIWFKLLSSLYLHFHTKSNILAYF